METANKKFRYSIRKFKVGVGSVLIATCLLGAGISTPTAFAMADPSPATEDTEVKKTPLQHLEELVEELKMDLEELKKFPEYDSTKYPVQKMLWDANLNFGKGEMERVSTLKEDNAGLSTIPQRLYDFRNHIKWERLTRQVDQYRKKYPDNARIEEEYKNHLEQTDDNNYASQEDVNLQASANDAEQALEKIKEIAKEIELKRSLIQNLKELVEELKTDLKKLNEFPEYDSAKYSFQKQLWDENLRFGKGEMGRVSTLGESKSDIQKLSENLANFRSHVMLERLTRQVAQYRAKYPDNQEIENEYKAHLEQRDDANYASQIGSNLKNYTQEAERSFEKIKEIVKKLEPKAEEPAPTPKEDAPAPIPDAEAPKTEKEVPAPAPVPGTPKAEEEAPKVEEETEAPKTEEKAPKEEEVPAPTPAPETPMDEPKMDEPKAEEPAPAPKEEEVPAPAPMPEAPKEEETPAPKEEPAPTPAPETPMDEPKMDEPKAEMPAPETPKAEEDAPAPTPMPEAPKEEEVPAPTPAPETPMDEPKMDEPKAEMPAPAPKEEEVPAPAPTPAPETPKAEEEAPAPTPMPEAPKEEETPAPTPAPETPMDEPKMDEPKAEEPAPAPKEEEVPAPAPTPAPVPETPMDKPKMENPKEEMPAPAPKEDEVPAPMPDAKRPEMEQPKAEDSAPKTAVPEVAPKTAEKPKLDFTTKERKVEEALPIKEEIRYDASLALGKSYLLQEGKAGKKVSVYQDVIVDGKVVATNLLSETVVEGQNRILVKGSLEMKKEEVKSTPSVQSNPTLSHKGAPSANKATLPATGEQRNNLALVGLGLAGISLAVIATAINKKSKDQI
ncbi:YSIRK-type signal peptide-containing protein [Streptococcus suis]|uniref:YSIRK-type signal peptide-containing protein n=2 Tax=Streptococcus suis TaxID=1307 RepID=A0A9Q5G1C1_STRSU|nr:GAG-binding domain-containing protein [Streptococcus suis]NQJ60678.1 YSIRK-type signal peptide-containing protein [Streptococcus suis]NQJ64912.1 YSIRK-type signal peptide-containing protein [Streptococcus suis]NQP70528.1 YSIRK-type signal peptide-containing protein [Streptococcus suis]NQP73747.1 YSIRK-type signal peptide-containing protein [Streptococcus suis]NQP79807.1 YSIRK-type signal peptide-containing protein [Streptococcus suis]